MFGPDAVLTRRALDQRRGRCLLALQLLQRAGADSWGGACRRSGCLGNLRLGGCPCLCCLLAAQILRRYGIRYPGNILRQIRGGGDGDEVGTRVIGDADLPHERIYRRQFARCERDFQKAKIGAEDRRDMRQEG